MRFTTAIPSLFVGTESANCINTYSSTRVPPRKGNEKEIVPTVYTYQGCLYASKYALTIIDCGTRTNSRKPVASDAIGDQMDTCIQHINTNMLLVDQQELFVDT